MAESRQIRVVRKCHELKEQGKSWDEIANALSSLGADYLMKTGEPYKVGTLMTMYSNNKHEILSDSEQDERNEKEPPDELNAMVKGCVQEVLDQRLPMIEETLASQVRQVVQEEISRHVVGGTGFRNEPKQEDDDLPPEPKEIKKKPGTKAKGRSRQNRDYVRHTVTVDSTLWRLFEKDMKRRRVSSASRMMDVILWNYYGKPALSYMTESQEPEKDSEENQKAVSDEE
jgi:hypothetical protein